MAKISADGRHFAICVKSINPTTYLIAGMDSSCRNQYKQQVFNNHLLLQKTLFSLKVQSTPFKVVICIFFYTKNKNVIVETQTVAQIVGLDVLNKHFETTLVLKSVQSAIKSKNRHMHPLGGGHIVFHISKVSINLV